jgi:hypothetical protein
MSSDYNFLARAYKQIYPEWKMMKKQIREALKILEDEEVWNHHETEARERVRKCLSQEVPKNEC